MGNLHSSGRYDKDTVIRHLWKALRAIPVLPINPHLAPLRVLTKGNDGYHDVGSVYSLCKPGTGKNSLRSLVSPSFFQTFTGLGKKKYFTTESIGTQTYNISDDHGAIAKLLVGEANAAAWFSRAKSIDVHLPECWVCEFKNENWEEMLQHFDPDMSKPFLGKSERNGKWKLYIVQKVVLVSHVQITASYRTTSGMNFQLPEVVPGSKVQTKVKVHGEETVVFTLSATKKDQKLPIAFSGLQYTYDKFGVREAKQGERTRNQPDTAASSSHGEDNEYDEDDEVVDEDTAANDEDMGDFFENEDDEWCISIISRHGQDEEDDDPAQNPASPAGSLPRDLEEIK